MPYIYDGVFVLLIVIGVLIGRHNGFLRELVKVLGGAAALICSYAISVIGSVFAFDMLLRDRIMNAVTEALPSAENASALLKSVSEKIAILPGSAGVYGEKKCLELEKIISDAASGAPAAITDSVISPVAVTVLKIIIFVIAFLVLMLVVKLIARLLKSVNDVPVIGPVNKFFGGMVGLIYAAIWLIILTAAVGMIIGAVNKGVFSEACVGESLVYKYFYDFICGRI